MLHDEAANVYKADPGFHEVVLIDAKGSGSLSERMLKGVKQLLNTYDDKQETNDENPVKSIWWATRCQMNMKRIQGS